MKKILILFLIAANVFAQSLTGIAPSASYKDLLHISNSNLGVDGTLRAVYDGAGNASALQVSTTGTSLGVATGTSLALGGATIGTNALAVTGTTLLNGALALGTNAITSVGSITSSGDINITKSNAGITLTAGTSVLQILASTNSTVYIGTTSNHNIIFQSNNLLRGGIMATGNWTIGTTTDNGNKLQVNGGISAGGNVVLAGGADRYIYLDETNTGTHSLILQGGGGSNTGGAVVMNVASHTTRPGWVTIGLPSLTTAKFAVNQQSTTQNGSDVFTVDYSGNATFAGSIAINNTVNTVNPTSPNRTITIVVGGTTYYIPAKTTND